MKTLLLTLFFAVVSVVPSVAMSEPTEQQQLCTAVSGVYNYKSPAVGKIDCINTVLVYKFSTIDTYKADVATLKMQTQQKHSKKRAGLGKKSDSTVFL